MKHIVVLLVVLSICGCSSKKPEAASASVTVTADSSEAYLTGDSLQSSAYPPMFAEKDSVSLPIALTKPNPEYPDSARIKTIDGTVIIKLWVDKTGKARKAAIDSTSNPIFNRPTLMAAMNWTFGAAKRNGVPVDITVKIPFRFKTNKAH